MSFQSSCPTCGAPIEFRIETSLVTVCGSCDTVVGRGDGKLEDYGKVADLVQTDSPLQVGLTGSLKGVSFEITGRTQLRHAAGGVWDEWYVAFHDGERWGWLSESQGRYHLTFRTPVPPKAQIPRLEDLELEDVITLPGTGQMKVAEIGQASVVAAEGEIPFVFRPGETYTYADLSGGGRKFATLDESEDPPVLYLGAEFSLERLGIDPHAASRDQEERLVAAVQISCPSCGGALELNAPNLTERICCPYCSSLHDVDQGNLVFIKKYAKAAAKPLIPLGSEGEFDGRKYKVIGFMRRSVRVEGVTYHWTEYLLYCPRQPFRWLVNSNRHWVLGESVPSGSVTVGGTGVRHEGRSYRRFEKSKPKVEYVLGEFYWKVEVGDEVLATDFISPPYSLSREVEFHGEMSDAMRAQAARQAAQRQPGTGQPGTGQPGTGPVVSAELVRPAGGPAEAAGKEVNWTLGRYVAPDEIERAFKLPHLERPTTIGPSQPFPYSGVYRVAGWLYAAAAVACLLIYVTAGRRQVYEHTLTLPRTSSSPTPGSLQTGTGATGTGATGSSAVAASQGSGGAVRPLTAAESSLSPTGGSRPVETRSEPIKLVGHRNIEVACTTGTRGSWAYVDAELYDETRRRTALKFTVPVAREKAGPGQAARKYLTALPPGEYSLVTRTQWQNMQLTPLTLTIRMRQGVPRGTAVVLLFVALAIVPVGVGVYQMFFESRRWSDNV